MELRTPRLEELQESYRELSPEFEQGGMDDRGVGGEDRYGDEPALGACQRRPRSVDGAARPCLSAASALGALGAWS